MTPNFINIFLTIFGYFVVVWIFTLLFTRRAKDKESFLVANRKLNYIVGAISIASAWVWAPALFVAAQKSYQQGIVGLFWFLFMNVGCLILFAPFAQKVRNKIPMGFTISDYMRDRYGNRVHKAYMFQLLGLAVASIGVQLLASGLVISAITGLPFWLITIILPLISLGYTMYAGMKSAVITDLFKFATIIIVASTLTPIIAMKAGGISAIVNGMGGLSGNFTNLFDANGIMVFLSFGLSTSIGLLSGPFGDQAFWQRSFSIKSRDVKKAFLLSAPLFAIVPIILSMLGFIGAGIGFETTSPQTINLEIVKHFMPSWVLIPFAWLLLSGLVGTIDSNLNSISSLMSDFIPRGQQLNLWLSKVGIVVFLILGVLVANIPNMQVLYLFMFYGSLRASTFLPTVISLLNEKKRISERGIFYGIIFAILIGLPIFAYGNYHAITPMIWGGSLTILAISSLTTLGFTYYESRRNRIS